MPVRPRSRAAALLALAVSAAALVACSGDDDGARSTAPSSTTTPGATSTSAPGTGTTSAPNLAAVRVTLAPVARVTAPTATAVRAGEPGALYVAEQAGRVRVLRDGRLVDAPVLDLTSRVGSGGERGLLGLAFSPDGSRLYVHYTDTGGDTRLDELVVRADGTVDAGSRREVLAVDQPQGNHNGGELTFGPDGMLYLGLGDGGGGGDEGTGHASGGNGQSLDTLLGKILRIDPRASAGRAYTIPADNPFVNGGGRPEIWSYGLRNPWRFSFDRATGDLWIGDVGQNTIEEIDMVTTASGRGKGVNFGWNRLEGTLRFRGDAPAGAVPPVFEYGRDDGCAVTGGYVYRGSAIPALQGAYVFADYCTAELRAIVVRNGQVVDERLLGVDTAQLSSFGEDAAGELYVLSQRDGILELRAA